MLQKKQNKTKLQTGKKNKLDKNEQNRQKTNI